MDTPTTTYQPTHISLCSGYGGIDLGLKRCISSLRTVAYAEIEAAACELLLARMEGGQLDAAPIWTDLKSFPWGAFYGKVDILSGGYPCQPFSSAGKRAGKDDPRHLWPWIADGIRILQPRVCFFENVEGHITLGLRDVFNDLGQLGYRATWGIFSAAECGAPHQRKRVFVLAVASGIRGAAGISKSFTGDERQSGIADNSCHQNIWPSRPNESQHAWEPPRVVANAKSSRQLERQKDFWSTKSDRSSAVVGDAEQQYDSGAIRANELQSGTGRLWPRRKPFTQTDRKSGQTQSSLGGNIARTSSGLGYGELCVSCDNRTDELRMLGNGVVPATAERAFRTLIKELLQ